MLQDNEFLSDSNLTNMHPILLYIKLNTIKQEMKKICSQKCIPHSRHIGSPKTTASVPVGHHQTGTKNEPPNNKLFPTAILHKIGWSLEKRLST